MKQESPAFRHGECQVPDKPKSIKRVIDTVRNHNFVEAHKRDKGGTEDVQAQ